MKNTRRLRASLRLWLVLLLCSGLAPVRLQADEPAKAKPAQPAASSSTTETPPPKESAAPPEATAGGDAAPSEEGQASDASVETSSPGNVTVDFKDADIQNVLRILSLKSGVNIVAGKDVTGNVTIRLVDVPWEKALDVVLKTYGYSYDRRDNIIRVATLENLRREELATEVFTLNYSRAADVEKSLKDILSERGRIRSDARSNTIIVTDMPTTLQSVREVIQRLDTITPQVLIEAKVIELTLGNADKLGIDWQLRVAANGASRPSSFPFYSVRRGPLDEFFPYGRGTTTGSVTVGSTAGTTTIEDFPKGKGAAESIQPTFPVADKVDFKFGSLDFTQFKAVLELIQSRDDAKILSEPHVTTLNNQEAKILVGEVISIPTFERNATTGKMEITGYRDRDVGIRLSVTPQVNSTNEIVVNIHPEITTLLGYDELTADIKAPHFTTREALTNVRIKNGQTIAIGGLIKENVVDRKTKIPILGDLPWLDKLFGHQDKSVQKTDLLFFMTVTVVGDKAVLQGHKL